MRPLRFAVLPLLALAACSEPTAPTPVGQVVVTPEAVELASGATTQLTATPRDANGTPLNGRVVTWASTDTAIATVDSAGRVTARLNRTAAVRSTQIRATSEGITAAATVSVAPIAVAVIVIAPDTLVLARGDTLRLTAEVRDSTGTALTGRELTWSSSNSVVVAVSADGLILGVSTGTAVIRASSGAARDSVRVTVPAPPAIALSGEILSTTRHSTCGILVGGALRCWGNNWYGQLGLGTTATAVFSPSEVGTDFERVSTGDTHTCGLRTSGEIQCWGQGLVGQLGFDPDGQYVLSPRAVDSPLTFRTVVSGATHACALTATGEAYCWGSGYPAGTAAGRYFRPTRVETTRTFISLSAYSDMTCGLTAAGEAFCWGRASKDIWGGADILVESPRRVAPDLTFTRFAASSTVVCGITSEDALFCWGSNVLNEVGDGTTVDRPTPVRIGGTTRYRAVAIGKFVCALTTDGVVECWGGRNLNGEMGNGTRTVPVLRPGAVLMPAAAIAITVGDAQACAVTAAGDLYCWGSDIYGQLGVGPYEEGALRWRWQPTPVVGGHRFRQP